MLIRELTECRRVILCCAWRSGGGFSFRSCSLSSDNDKLASLLCIRLREWLLDQENRRPALLGEGKLLGSAKYDESSSELSCSSSAGVASPVFLTLSFGPSTAAVSATGFTSEAEAGVSVAAGVSLLFDSPSSGSTGVDNGSSSSVGCIVSLSRFSMGAKLKIMLYSTVQAS